MFTLRQLKEFDTIYFIENEGLLKTFSEIDIDPSKVIFFLDKGVIKCRIPAIEGDSEILEYYYFEHVRDNIWILDIYALQDSVFNRLYALAIDFDLKQKSCPFSFEAKFLNPTMKQNYEKNKDYYINTIFYSHSRIFYGVFAHFTNLIEQEGSVLKKVRAKRISSSHSVADKINNQKHKIKLINNTGTEYELEINNSVYTKLQREKKQAYRRHIEAWTVRGHLRHYKKTGKEVLIKPYKKGEGKVSAKDYILNE